MKKWFWGSKCLFLLLLGLTACGPRERQAGKPDGKVLEWDENGREEITFLIPYDNPVHRQVIEAMLEDFEGSNPQTAVKPEWVSDRDYEKSLSSLNMKSQVPDMVLVDNAYIPLLASGGALSSLDLWLAETGLRDRLEQSAEEGLIVEKTQYGCPFLCWSYGLFFQEDILKRSGCSLPGSWEQWEAYGTEVQRINNIQPFALAGADSEELAYQLLEILQEQGVILQRMHYETDCYGLELMERQLKQNTLAVNSLSWNQADLTRTFAKGNLACMMNRSTQIPFLKSLNPSMEWSVVEPYCQAEGNHVLGIQSIAITKEAGDGAYELLEWLMEEEQVMRLARELNSIPVRTDVRKRIKEENTENYVSMDWGERMRFGGSYLSWGSISKEIRSAFRRMLMGDMDARECFQEMKYNMDQYLYLLIYE